MLDPMATEVGDAVKELIVGLTPDVGEKLAVTVVLLFTVTEHFTLDPEQAPDQPVKSLPVLGAAWMLMVVPAGTVAASQTCPVTDLVVQDQPYVGLELPTPM